MRKRALVAVMSGAASIAVALGAVGGGAAPGVSLTDVPAANTKSPGYAPPNALSAELRETAVARGAMHLDGAATDGSSPQYYGYDGDGPMVPALGSNVESSKTEPDKNTYLVLDGQHGPDTNAFYGTHFLFQGHETGKPGYITRVNLDADAAHRVTLMATTDVNDKPLPVYDGSTWDPFAKRLLFTAENGTSPSDQRADKINDTGGVWAATLDYPSKVTDISGSIGRAGYEGIQNDKDGNVWIVEDNSGDAGTGANTKAKQPNSFVFRFVPTHKDDLSAGKLQALQVISRRTNQPITFHDLQADADITSPDTADLYTYGTSFDTKWVTVHDTATDGTTPFDANKAAKMAGATPFKRPENGQFRPGTNFGQFFFDSTGDTNAQSSANTGLGGWGGIFQLTQNGPSANTGKLKLFYQTDEAHTGLDNVAFLTKNHVVFVEDAGDTLHTQRNALDSAYVFDVTHDYSKGGQPIRMLAEGRDASATIDSGLSGTTNFQNEGDNEITGIHVSNGDPTRNGLLGAADPNPFFGHGTFRWRVFYTAQHGDNVTYEIETLP
jgi:Alkaline phosphatase PhoX